MEITEGKSNERTGRPLSQRLTRVTQELFLPHCGLRPPCSVQSAPLSLFTLRHLSRDHLRPRGLHPKTGMHMAVYNARRGASYFTISGGDGSPFMADLPALIPAIRSERAEELAGIGRMLRGSIRNISRRSGAGRSGPSERAFSAFPVPDANGVIQRGYENLAVADLSGLRGL